MRFPPAFWEYARLRDWGGKPPWPPPIPNPVPVSWKIRYALHRGVKPKPVYTPSLFSELGGFVSQAGSFPPDTPSARAFQAAGGRWLAVQFGDPATDQGNRARFQEGWAGRWRALDVQVGCWWRVEHVGLPGPKTPAVDFLIPNPESQAELDRLPGILQWCREMTPRPLAVITLGKMPGFPTGLLDTLDAHLIPECFLETAASDTNVTNSVRFWLDSQVPLARIHPCLFNAPGNDRYPVEAAVAEARALGVRGLSSFTAENTPATAWAVMT